MYKFCPYCGSEVERIEDNGFKCPSCNHSIYINPKPGIAIIPIVGDEIAVCIRAREPMSGEIDFLGGYLEMGETPVGGAVRELNEETGVRIEKDQLELVGIWKDEYMLEGVPEHTLNITYVVQFEEKPGFIPNDDVADIKWIPLEEDIDFAFEFQKQVFEHLRKII